MKRVILLLFVPGIFLLNTGVVLKAEKPVFQDESEELIPSADSVSIDDMDPIFYEAEEDEEPVDEGSGKSPKLLIGFTGIIILLVVGYVFIRKSGSKE
ncbi:MAG: hypothetical protein JSV24_12460 [Bacteroidales bacterium]|nr:MAG: hypothetical protein JSV24_12460 [Bacteroidales bacterium]